MNSQAQRQYLLAGLFLLLLIMLLQFRTVGQSVSLPSSASQSAHVLPAPTHQRIPKAKVTRTAPVKVLRPAQENGPTELRGISLNSLMRRYTYVFSGVVSCGEQPCAADLDMVVESTRNAALSHRIQAQSDGTYRVEVTLSELEHEPISWRIRALSADLKVGEAHGQRILMDDLLVAIDQPITLH